MKYLTVTAAVFSFLVCTFITPANAIRYPYRPYVAKCNNGGWEASGQTESPVDNSYRHRAKTMIPGLLMASSLIAFYIARSAFLEIEKLNAMVQ